MDGLTYFVIAIVSFFIGVFITRWIFGIKELLRLQTTQTANLTAIRKTLSALALKNGITEQEIKNIIVEANAEALNAKNGTN